MKLYINLLPFASIVPTFSWVITPGSITARPATALRNYAPYEVAYAAYNTENENYDDAENDEATTVETINESYDVDNENSAHTLKSNVYIAQPLCEESGKPVGEEVAIKVSTNHGDMAREAEIYDTLDSDKFVEKHEYLEPTHEKDASAIVMELGSTDMKDYIQENAPLGRLEINEKAMEAVEILAEVHNTGHVWCEMKAENLVIVDDGDLKGIDVESVTLQGSLNIFHTPGGTPPEFAIEALDKFNLPMKPSFDIWGLGMFLYQLAVGEHYYTGKYQVNDHQGIFEYLKAEKNLDLSKLDILQVDSTLRDLIHQCLKFDPNLRPTIHEVQSHPFFASASDP